MTFRLITVADAVKANFLKKIRVYEGQDFLKGLDEIIELYMKKDGRTMDVVTLQTLNESYLFWKKAYNSNQRAIYINYGQGPRRIA